MNRKLSILYTVIFIACLTLLLLTVSIGLPIYLRFFYYLQIKPLGLEEASGYSYSQIVKAYNDVLNYLTLPGFTFKTGEMLFSQSGADHFADCKFLFDLNLTVMIISTVGVVALSVLSRKKIIEFKRPFNYNPSFLSAIIALVLPIVLGCIISIDFNKAFIIFHAIFFPGKDNWVFDPTYDEIITVMPQEFFMNCAILIGVGLVIISCTVITVNIIKKKKSR